MPRKQLSTVLQLVRAALGGRGGGDTTDADLLARFATVRDEAAFAELLARHGSLVLGVCRRVLGNAADADDAFQATFLVLVQKAASIRKGASVASWLHGVAYRVALEARTRAARRRAHESRAEREEAAEPSGEAAAHELRSILDEELTRLPEKYRSPLVLHYLAGQTKEETARQLGWTEGTVSGRLARARDLLRQRLSRRGLGLPGAALPTLVREAAVPVTLVSSSLSIGMLFVAGEVATQAGTARVVALSERVVKAMSLNKLRVAVAVLLLAAVAGLGVGGLLYRTQANPGPRVKDEPPPRKKGTVVRAPGSYTLAVALTPDGTTLARGGADHTVDLWDVVSGKRLHTLKGHTVPLLRLAFSPDGKTLASITGSWLPDEVRGEVKLWDVATGKELVTLKGHPTRGICLAFSADGKTLATGSTTVKLWDVATGKEKLELKPPRQAPVPGDRNEGNRLPWSVAFSPDGKTLAMGTGGSPMGVTPGEVILWDAATGKQRATLSKHPNSITWIGFSPDGKTLASASGCGLEDDNGQPIDLAGPLPGQIKLWDVARGKERATLRTRLTTPLQFFDLVFTRDGKTLIAATASFGDTTQKGGIAVQRWEVATGKTGPTFWAPFNAGGPGAGTNAGIYFTALSAGGRRVAWGGVEQKDGKVTGTAEVWDVRSLATSAPGLPSELLRARP